MLPEIKPIIKPIIRHDVEIPQIAPASIKNSVKNAYDNYYLKDNDVTKNIALLNLLREQERERNVLLEKFRQAQKK